MKLLFLLCCISIEMHAMLTRARCAYPTIIRRSSTPRTSDKPENIEPRKRYAPAFNALNQRMNKFFEDQCKYIRIDMMQEHIDIRKKDINTLLTKFSSDMNNHMYPPEKMFRNSEQYEDKLYEIARGLELAVRQLKLIDDEGLLRK